MEKSSMECLILCGIPCSGKSTYVQKLRTLKYWENCVVLSTDNYIEQRAQELNKTHNDIFKETIKEANNNLQQELDRAIDDGKDIIWDQTNLTIKIRKNKLSRLPSQYRKCSIYFTTSLDAALKRNKTREGKFIPEDVMTSMFKQFEIPTIAEGFDYVECAN
jgi:predicted kinase